MVEATLLVTVIEARELVNKDGLFGKNDAYCTLKIGKQKEKTSVIKNAGSKATWNQTFNFKIPDESAELSVECLDYDVVSSNDTIGKIKIPLQAIRNYGTMENWYPLADGGKFGGEVHLLLKYSGPNKATTAPTRY